MLAPVLWLITRVVAYLARPILGLRYRLEIRGAEAIRARGRRGILFLPNHTALIDPALIVAWLYPSFGLRPLADEHQVGRTIFGYIALLYGSRILPNLERSGADARDRTRQALQDIATGLTAGENVLLYPSGRLKRQTLEDVGSASGTETIVKAVPDARVVLIRQRGLWGSSFSLGYNGEMPDIGAALARGIKYLLLNGLFFMPKRRMTVASSSNSYSRTIESPPRCLPAPPDPGRRQNSRSSTGKRRSRTSGSVSREFVMCVCTPLAPL
jgi:acyl-[acyl-carrier-protein]-phospholipid O-acyltransferase/long-chain-fatty-acid--[acyl-carrier-protein] ligase